MATAAWCRQANPVQTVQALTLHTKQRQVPHLLLIHYPDWQGSHHAHTLCCVRASEDLGRLELGRGKKFLLLLLWHNWYRRSSVQLHGHWHSIDLNLYHDRWCLVLFQVIQDLLFLWSWICWGQLACLFPCTWRIFISASRLLGATHPGQMPLLVSLMAHVLCKPTVDCHMITSPTTETFPDALRIVRRGLSSSQRLWMYPLAAILWQLLQHWATTPQCLGIQFCCIQTVANG